MYINLRPKVKNDGFAEQIAGERGRSGAKRAVVSPTLYCLILSVRLPGQMSCEVRTNRQEKGVN